ncbi:MAG TPA: EAL domain-containing protein, partial [Spirochaetes bacterium]|nr:EAL domain-containing protein [Spirochaetota bacterium]
AIDEWVLRAACKQGKIWQDAGLSVPRLSVNLSVRQFSRKSLVETIEEILHQTGFNPKFLELEITESSIMQNLDDGIHTLNRLRKLGICIAIDDFGTGYSSLSYLKRLPIDTLKIDQSFIRDMIHDSSDAAIVTAIITMGQNLNMKVLAEGVEEKSHADFLQEYHCDEAQGYYYSRPMPSGDVPTFLLNY